MDQERRSQREMMQENEKQARTTYTNAQAKAAMSRRDNKASKLRVELTDPRKSNYFYEEALKTLRTNIQFAGADIKTILVTSCFPNEGKSDVTFQLAVEIGKQRKWVWPVRRRCFWMRISENLSLCRDISWIVT